MTTIGPSFQPLPPPFPIGGPGAAGPAAAADAPAPLARGARGPAVQALQNDLIRAGFDLGPTGTDGAFGRDTENAIALLQRRAGLPPTGTVDATTAATVYDRANVRLSGAIGPGQRNDPIDVRAVERRLSDLGFYKGPIDGIYGPGLAGALRLFDGSIRGLQKLEDSAAGRRGAETALPGGTTERWLRAQNAPRWHEMPKSGVGFANIDADHHDYGTSWLAEAIAHAGASYEASYRRTHPGSFAISTNDASLRHGGDTDDHKSHESGLDLDVRIGPQGGMTFRSAGYDREAVWAQMKAFLDTPNVVDVIFNDPDLVARANADPKYRGRVLTDPEGIHDNHVHVDIRPPAPIERR